MIEKLNELEKNLSNLDEPSLKKVPKLLKSLFKDLTHEVENYIGDFPTFIEPVHLEGPVKIGDDVLLGPNVYIGKNVEIGDYNEISNSVIFDNVRLGENMKIEDCIILKDSVIDLSDSFLKRVILSGNNKKSPETFKRIAF